MRAFWALMGREIRIWQGLFWVALALTLLSLSLPLWSGFGGDAAAVSDVAALVFLALIAVAGPLFVGAGIFGRDLAEDRAGFLFGLPLRPLAVVTAKFTGATVVVYLSLASLLAVARSTGVVIGEISWRATPWTGEGIGRPYWNVVCLLAPLVLLCLAHLGGLAFRARSRWVLLDLGLGWVLTWVLWRTVRRLAGAPIEQALALLVFMVLVVGSLFYATAEHLRSGEVLLERAHRRISLHAWPLLVAAAGLVFVWGAWVRHVGPEDLEEVSEALAGPGGELVFATGSYRGRPSFRPVLAVDRAGQGVEPGFTWWWGEEASFTRDGKQAFWLGWEAAGVKAVVGVGATVEGLERIATTLPRAGGRALAASPDGRVVGVVDPAGFYLLDPRSGAVLQVLPMRNDWEGVAMRFTGEGEVRGIGYPWLERGIVESFRIDLAAKRVERARLADLSPPRFGRIARDGGRLLVVPIREGREQYLLFDLDRGEALGDLQRGDRAIQSVRWLEDGDLAVAEIDQGRARVRRLDRDGQERTSTLLGPAERVSVAGRVGQEIIVTTLRPAKASGSMTSGQEAKAPESAFWALDEVGDARRIAELEGVVYPLVPIGISMDSPPDLFLSASRVLLRYDYDQGHFDRVLGRGEIPKPIG